MSKLLDTIKEMVVAMSRMEKKPVEAKNPSEASELGHVPPLPPLQVQFSHIPNAPHEVGMCDILALGMPVGVLLHR